MLGVGILPGAVTVTGTSGGTDFYLDLSQGDGILIGGAGPVVNSDQSIEHVDFADGTSWNAWDLLELSAPSNFVHDNSHSQIEILQHHFNEIPGVTSRLVESLAAFGRYSGGVFDEVSSAKCTESSFISAANGQTSARPFTCLVSL